MSLSIFDAATEQRASIGLIAGGRAHSFAELADRARAAPPVDRVVADASVDTVASIHAALAARRPLALLHPRLTEAERAALPAPGAARGLTVYTSGSTGTPKPVALTEQMLTASARASEARLGWRDDDRWLCPLPLAHVGGLSVITRCLLARRCAVLGGVDDLAATDATLASVVPTLLARMVERPCPPRLRAVLVGGAGCPPTLWQRAIDTGYPVLATYGMTEACSQIATEQRAGDGLVPLAGAVEVRVIDGHIQVRGPAVVGDDWLDTGDLGRLDERGRLQVFGRADDVIVTGGENVHPLEVERALADLPGVREACVFGLPDAQWGQLVCAALVADAPIDDAALATHVAARLAPYKWPRRVCRVDALPRNATGKLDRRAAAQRTATALRPLAV